MYIVLFWNLLNMVVKHLWQRYVCNGDRIFYGVTINLLSQMTYYWISENIFSDTDITVKGQYQTMYSVGAVLGKMLFNFPVPCQIDHITYCLFYLVNSAAQLHLAVTSPCFLSNVWTPSD